MSAEHGTRSDPKIGSHRPLVERGFLIVYITQIVDSEGPAGGGSGIDSYDA